MPLQCCPVCGGPPKLHKKKSSSWRYWYECDGNCWTQTDKHSTPEDAAAEWQSLKAPDRSVTDEP